MNAQKYIDIILRDKLQIFYNSVQEQTEQIPVVIEDNATCHSAKICKAERQQ
jgi:hypothetical protein